MLREYLHRLFTFYHKITMMKKAILPLIAALALSAFPVQAESDSSELKRDALRLGINLLDHIRSGKEDKKAETPAETAPAAAKEPGKKDKVKEILASGAADLLQGGREQVAKQVSAIVRECMDQIIGDYKAQYKEEGREYARELSNIVSDKVLEHEKVKGTLNSVQALCWGVVAYLTVLSIIFVILLNSLNRKNKQLAEQISELKKASH